MVGWNHSRPGILNRSLKTKSGKLEGCARDTAASAKLEGCLKANPLNASGKFDPWNPLKRSQFLFVRENFSPQNEMKSLFWKLAWDLNIREGLGLQMFPKSWHCQNLVDPLILANLANKARKCDSQHFSTKVRKSFLGVKMLNKCG